MKIGIIIAMDIEYQQMVQALGGKTEGRIGNNDIVLWQCGIGKVNAAIGTMNLIRQHHPDCILSTGLAGGIDADLHVMDVVVASQSVYHDVWCGEGNEKGQVQGLPARFDANEALCRCAMQLKSCMTNGSRVHLGLICTGDQFITSHDEQAKIKQCFFDGLACDMESAAIAHTCYLQDVPFMSIRVISDTPGNTDDHQQQWESFLKDMCQHSFDFVLQYLNAAPSQL